MRRALLASSLGCALAALGCISINLPYSGVGPLEETLVDGKSGPKILLVDVAGSLTTHADSGRFGLGGRESPTARMREEIERALEDEEIAALLLRIDPGGTVIGARCSTARWCSGKTKRTVIARWRSRPLGA